MLIVEDDVTLNSGIMLSLRQNDVDIQQAYNIKQAKQMLCDKKIELIILDVNLPDGSGFELCKEIRQASQVPIIFLTANDLEIDIVTGLELGGDDYITKPFSLMVLRARVRAILRRVRNIKSDNKITIDNMVFNFDTMEFTKNGVALVLSKTEQKLLKILLNNKVSILSRSQLVDKVWSDGAEYVDENALTVNISRLRNKIEDNPNSPKYIKTIYGMGYMWAGGESFE
ncbi:response regulator transcription factor [Clostridium tagluense]|uniref:response regulator transcription factor n=1 Tax=Clostridium tagluense TaxID=360422 RepID=UPI001CF3EF5F|nr:response regulator transcription factor [Clostridium tagluense]MCB2312888.1 response regulator transcription factor [Clostridium tagluense]MCB2317654.1 response regulator transcription factor [Clostridium tagluense]MCB2322389.1 response regulator transcription factor [Clostridium tagluense]MCB2327392.1 response regulator transcription factor [Clostridium tagluense]MCB2332156.1 response regulator transcription factor [Clostridium tagluense]